MLGAPGVGKTSIARRFVDDAFANNYIHTIGIDFLEKIIECQGQQIKLQIWDTAGQERFKTITPTYYKGADGIIVVFDLTNQQSYDNVKKWLEEIEQYTSGKKVNKLLVGSKCDLIGK